MQGQGQGRAVHIVAVWDALSAGTGGSSAACLFRPCSPACPLLRRWQCSNGGCLQSYGRHSNSIDVAKKVCGACRAPLTFLGKFRPDGTPAKPRAANKMAQFVKEHMAQGGWVWLVAGWVGWAGCWLPAWLADAVRCSPHLCGCSTTRCLALPQPGHLLLCCRRFLLLQSRLNCRQGHHRRKLCRR